MRLAITMLFLCACSASSTQPTAGDACTDGGARDCEDETTLMCLCDGDDPFAADCGEDGGTWTEQTTLCDSCDDWIDDTCPVE